MPVCMSAGSSDAEKPAITAETGRRMPHRTTADSHVSPVIVGNAPRTAFSL